MVTILVQVGEVALEKQARGPSSDHFHFASFRNRKVSTNGVAAIVDKDALADCQVAESAIARVSRCTGIVFQGTAGVPRLIPGIA